MDTDGVPYASPRDFERALTDRLANAGASSPYGVQELRRQFAYGRLLTRVFLHDPERWVLKGATGLLARLPGQARHSIDVDLYFEGELNTALDVLREAAALDVGDYFTFDVERGAALAGVTAGGQLRVTAYLGDKVFETFRIDVVVTHTMTADPDSVSPIAPVEIPGSAASLIGRIRSRIRSPTNTLPFWPPMPVAPAPATATSWTSC